MTNRNKVIFSTAAVLALLAGSVGTAFAGHGTAVGPITGTVTQKNYDENGNVNGFVVGTSLLTFPAVCSGIGALDVSGSVTYSGLLRTDADGTLSTVSVTSFTPTTGTYTPATSTSTPYTSTAGTLGALNYDSSGEVDGFFWKSTAPVAGTVLVNVDAEALAKAGLTPATVTSVTGTTRTSSCGASSTVVIQASALNGIAIHSGDHQH